MEIRLARESDLAAINAIYNYYVLNSTCTYQINPESEESRVSWFRGRSEKHPVTVAELGCEVVGWASLSRYHPREGFARTVENSVYVRHDKLREGIGGALLADILERARQLDYHVVIAGVSSEQSGSIALHEKFAFQKIAHFREVAWKHERWLDLISLQLFL